MIKRNQMLLFSRIVFFVFTVCLLGVRCQKPVDEKKKFSVTVYINPTSSGTVNLDPGGNEFQSSANVKITALPAQGFQFSHWTGDLTGSLENEKLVMTENKFVTAHFKPLTPAGPDFSLTGYATLNGGTTGGAGGQTVIANNLTELNNYCNSDLPLIIQLNKKLISTGTKIIVGNNKSIIGVGTEAELEGVGFEIRSKNIIIRNIKMSKVLNAFNAGDCIRIMDGASNIWIDHCEFFNESPATQLDKDKYDGLVDATGTSSYITISWCIFRDHWKSNLVGSSESDNYNRRITFHHNYWKNINSRTPSYRYGEAHIFNCLYENVDGGINSRMGACIKVENNVFRSVKNPIAALDTDTNGGWMISRNVFVNCTGLQPVSSTCSLNIPYHYSNVLHETTEVEQLVKQWAGTGKL